jgi:A/G-specific adenine glycosylase
MQSEADIRHLQQAVGDYFKAHHRRMPWRPPTLAVNTAGELDPYPILVSELMLQQTQVARVVPKFQAFMAAFPDVHALAAASLADVLVLWSGLGYNRRAKYLWEAARMVVSEYGGEFPRTAKALTALPGVGPNTAGAILAYAFDQPAVFIETNIRSVFIRHCFAGRTGVTDAELRPLIEASIPTRGIREWYYALMDYGSYLKTTEGNAARHSKHYVKQSPLEGSRRQVRGRVLKYLAEGPHTATKLAELIKDERLTEVLADLQNERLIQKKTGAVFYLGS